MKCSFCGYDFQESESEQACKACIMSKNCNLVRCPKCGFELPVEPKWLKKLFGKEKSDGTLK